MYELVAMYVCDVRGRRFITKQKKGEKRERVSEREKSVSKGSLEVTRRFLQLPFALYRFTWCTIFARKSRFARYSLKKEKPKQQLVICNFLKDFSDELTYAYSLNTWRANSARFTLKQIHRDIISFDCTVATDTRARFSPIEHLSPSGEVNYVIERSAIVGDAMRCMSNETCDSIE